MDKVNNFKFFIGVDVSKKTLDITVLHCSKLILYRQIENNESCIQSFIDELKGENIELNKSLFCAEHTGVYNTPLKNVLSKNRLFLWVESAIQIKRSSGMIRGKNDKIDSYRIALYAFKNQTDARQWTFVREQLAMLKKLVALRKRLENIKKQLMQPISEKEFLSNQEKKILMISCGNTLREIHKDIIETERQMKKIILGDEELTRLYTIVTSVDGIGMHTAIEIIVTTNEFKNITEAKKYACYSGVVPFEYTSGTSLKKKARVSKMANTSIKTLLHMSALSVINMDCELKEYYYRKVKEGKNKMAVINAIRNKLILRVFACVRNNRLYQKNYQFSFG